MSLTRLQIETRIRSMLWQVPGRAPRNLWGAEGKDLLAPGLLKVLINQGLKEWAIENLIDRQEFGHSGGNQLSANSRGYTLPSDLLVVEEAKVAYDNSTGFLGYPIIIIAEHNLDSQLAAYASRGGLLAGNVRQWSYRDYALSAADETLIRTTGKTITYASLGADISGNTPPDTFDVAPFFVSCYAEANRGIWVDSNDTSGFTIKAMPLGKSAPFNISFSFRDVFETLSASAEGAFGIPQRMFIHQNSFYLDPIPNDNYTFKMYGWHLPADLSADASTPDPMAVYHESIFLKIKELVARELNVVNEGQIVGQAEKAAQRARKFDSERHEATRFVKQGNEFWEW